jgi:hypothetical protein
MLQTGSTDNVNNDSTMCVHMCLLEQCKQSSDAFLMTRDCNNDSFSINYDDCYACDDSIAALELT